MTDTPQYQSGGDTGQAPSADAQHRLRYDNSAGDRPLIGRHVVNVLLMIVTLGLYRFWAITWMRRLVWRRSSIDGQPFEYSGTGIEIFLGFLKVFFLILLPIGLAFAAVGFYLGTDPSEANLAALEIADAAYGVVVFFLIELGRFLSWRYRVSRTRWRGIRSRIDMRVSRYLAVALGSAFLLIFSVWLLKPVVDLWRARVLVNNVNIGGMRPSLDTGLAALLPRWFLCLVIAFVSYAVSAVLMGIVVVILLLPAFQAAQGASPQDLEPFLEGFSVWHLGLMGALFLAPVGFLWAYCLYRVAYWRHVCTSLRFGTLRFRFTGTTNGLFWLKFSNFLILVLSLTLLAPITWRRKIEYAARSLEISGSFDPSDLRQVMPDEGSVGGEGLAGDFDIA